MRQFLSPVLVAVLLTGLVVAVISTLAANNASKVASVARMKSIGQIISQSTYPKNANVLENLKTLTRLEFVLLRWDASREMAIAEQATLKLDQNNLNRIAQSLTRRTVASKQNDLLVNNIQIGAAVIPWTGYSSDSNWLVVLDPHVERGNAWFVFSLPLVTGLLSTLGIAVVAAWTVRKFSKRIEILEKEVAAIAFGNFSPRPILGPNDAIRSLHNSLYLMGKQLEKSKRQIEINERTRLIHMIGSGLAHELRNHLAGARLALQTVEVEKQDQEAIAVCLKQLDLAETQIRRLLAIRPGGDALDSAPLSISSIQESVLKFAGPIANHQKVALHISKMDMPIGNDAKNNLPVDPEDLGEIQVSSGASMVGVILNIVLNAIEAVGSADTGEGAAARATKAVGATGDVLHSDKQVHLKAGVILAQCETVPLAEREKTGPLFQNSNHTSHPNKTSDLPPLAMVPPQAMVQWIVSDNGPGPNSSMVKSMFEPFATTKREGVGLGLAMCKHVVENCDGSIHWRRDDGWTHFEIRIPIVQS